MLRRLAGATVAAGLVGCFSLVATAQEIARLYAPQAPAGSSYVRVVNATQKPKKIEFGNRSDILGADAGRIATDYRVVDAGVELMLKVEGRAPARIRIKPDSFVTLVLDDSGQLPAIVDATGERNDLKAELRFYNLARGCNATLAIENGPAVFQHIDYGLSARRSVNPVQARLLGSCATGVIDSAAAAKPAVTPATALPPLKSGDRASLFLLGDSAHPRLTVQTDATEPYAAAH